MSYNDISIVTELKDDGLYLKFSYNEKNYKSIVSHDFIVTPTNFVLEPIQFIQNCLNRTQFHHYQIIKIGDQFEIIFSYQYECFCVAYKVVFLH